MKAILIARVSTEEQREAGNSLPAQVVRLERYCQNKSFQILEVCSFDETAYSNDRSKFDNIIDLILSQTEKVIVCCDKVDRLSRNVFDKRISILYEKALNDEIELHFVSDGQIITSRISAVEKFQFSISLGLAKYYSDAISDNVKRALEQKVRKGEWLAKAPYGYKNIKKPDGSTDIIVDEYEAHLVKTIFALYGTGAYSMDLLRAKLKKDFGLDLHKASLGKMLNNPFYHGVMIVKDKEYPHRYPPIISKASFDQVRQFKEGFLKRPYKYRGRSYIYRGLINCGDCGLAVTPENHNGYIYYHCTQYRGKHNAKWLREETITQHLEDLFKRLQTPKHVVDEILENIISKNTDKIEFYTKQYNRLIREQTVTTQMLDNLYLDKLKGRITDSEYDRFYQQLRDQASNLEAQLEQLEEADENFYHEVKLVLELTGKVFRHFSNSEVEEKRQIIKLVLSNFTITGENLVLDVHKPFDMILEHNDHLRWRG